ncbi:MAG TPA: helix-turn-helix domain-containing protein [Thermoplasmata archaeon]
MEHQDARHAIASLKPVPAARLLTKRGGPDDVRAGAKGTSVLRPVFENGTAFPATLKQALRRRIYDHVRAHPGETFTNIKRALGLSTGGLTHHLRVLERAGLIRSRSQNGRKMHRSAEARAPANGDGRSRTQERFLRALARAPGAPISDVAGILGISRQLATYHARLLAQQGLVRLERPEDRLRAILVRGPRVAFMTFTASLPTHRLGDAVAETRGVFRRGVDVLLSPGGARPPRLRRRTGGANGRGGRKRGPTSAQKGNPAGGR